MTTAPDNCSLSSNQDTNLFFGVSGDWFSNLLFNNMRLFPVKQIKSHTFKNY